MFLALSLAVYSFKTCIACNFFLQESVMMMMMEPLFKWHKRIQTYITILTGDTKIKLVKTKFKKGIHNLKVFINFAFLSETLV